MEQNTKNLNEVSSIDIAKIWQSLKKHKRLYVILLPVSFVVGCIIALSLHNYYSCTVKLAPELSNRSRSVSLGNLASQLGINMGTSSSGMDALYPTLYPDLMNSVDFKVSLFPILIHKRDSTRQMTYYDYLKNEQKAPWWSEAIGSSIKWLISLVAEEKPEETEAESYPEGQETSPAMASAEQMSYRTIKAEPDNSTFLDTYAWILFRQQRYSEAKIYIEQALRCDSLIDGVVKEHAGDIFALNGDIDRAMELWQQAQTDDPDNKILRRKIKRKKYLRK